MSGRYDSSASDRRLAAKRKNEYAATQKEPLSKTAEGDHELGSPEDSNPFKLAPI